MSCKLRLQSILEPCKIWREEECCAVFEYVCVCNLTLCHLCRCQVILVLLCSEGLNQRQASEETNDRVLTGLMLLQVLVGVVLPYSYMYRCQLQLRRLWHYEELKRDKERRLIDR